MVNDTKTNELYEKTIAAFRKEVFNQNNHKHYSNIKSSWEFLEYRARSDYMMGMKDDWNVDLSEIVNLFIESANIAHNTLGEAFERSTKNWESAKVAKKEAEELTKELEEAEVLIAKQQEQIEELLERVEDEVENSLEAIEKSELYHERKVFTLMAQKDTSLIEAQLKIQELEKDLRIKNEKIVKLSKPSKFQQLQWLMNKSKEKVREKFYAFIIQKDK